MTSFCLYFVWVITFFARYFGFVGLVSAERHVETYTRVWEIWSPTVSVCSWGMRLVFVLHIIFLLEFSKSLKSHQIRSAQSNDWLWAVFSGKLAKLFWATLCGHRMFIQISLMCYEREISFNNLLMCQIFTFESSRVVNSGWPVCGCTKDSEGGG